MTLIKEIAEQIDKDAEEKLNIMHPDYEDSYEYMDNSTRAHRNGYKAGYIAGAKKYAEYQVLFKRYEATLQIINLMLDASRSELEWKIQSIIQNCITQTLKTEDSK